GQSAPRQRCSRQQFTILAARQVENQAEDGATPEQYVNRLVHWSSPLSDRLLQCWQEVLGYLQNAGTGSHQEHGGKNEEEKGGDQLHSHFPRTFLRFLTAANPHEIRMHTQRIGNTGAEAVGLNHDGDQLLQFALAGARGQIVQRFRTSLAGAHFERNDSELLANGPVGQRELTAHAHESL